MDARVPRKVFVGRNYKLSWALFVYGGHEQLTTLDAVLEDDPREDGIAGLSITYHFPDGQLLHFGEWSVINKGRFTLADHHSADFYKKWPSKVEVDLLFVKDREI